MISVFETQGKQPDKTAEIIKGLEHISNIFRTLLSEQAAEHELSILQVQILLQLYFNNTETWSGIALAQKLNLSKATISTTLKSLERKRLIIKKKDNKDSRACHSVLTEWGKQIAHIAGFYPEPLKGIIAPIATREKEILLKNINGIIDKFKLRAD